MGVKRRAFLIGSAAVIGGGIFGLKWADSSATSTAAKLTAGKGEHSFATWVKIAEDDVVTLYSPHIDFGQGSHTALAQMLAEELDADWAKMKVEQAPAESAFANVPLGRAFIGEMSGYESVFNAMPTSIMSMLARSIDLQITGGSSAVRMTGQRGVRLVGAATRNALIAIAADRLNVPAAELTTLDSKVTHARSGKSLRYGELAADAARRSLDPAPVLKDRKDYRFIGKPVARFDVPNKVDGSAQYGIDFTLPDMRVATVMAAPVRGGKLASVEPAPALAIKGVEQVLNFEDSVVVVAKGYWPAIQGLRALSPKFTDGGHGALSSASLFAAQDKLRGEGKPTHKVGSGDVAAGLATPGAKMLEADYRLPFLHQAMMEPFALTAQFKNGKLEMWGGLQDPLGARGIAAKAAGLSASDVTFHPMIMGGGFGRRFPPYSQIIGQAALLAKRVPYPVKLIWSREEDVKQGAYRPQSSAHLKAALGSDGRIKAWQTDYVQFPNAETETFFPYDIPAARHHYEHISNQVDAYWRSVNSTQHGFYNESFIDELAHAAGADPFEFRRKHLKPGSRHLAVLEQCAKLGAWGTPLPAGTGRGIALVESFGTIAAHVTEATLNEDGTPKVLKVTAVIDCGTTVNPLNAEAQIMGGIIMGLSSAIGEAITLENGAVVQNSFTDYPILKLADTPEITVHFIESGATMGGIGEPGLPPSAPALTNALFAATGKRVRNLPILDQAKA